MSNDNKKTILFVGPVGKSNSGLANYLSNISSSNLSNKYNLIFLNDYFKSKNKVERTYRYIQSLLNLVIIFKNNKVDIIMLHNNSISLSFLFKYIQIIFCKISSKKIVSRFGAGTIFFNWLSKSSLFWNKLNSSYIKMCSLLLVQSKKDLCFFKKYIESTEIRVINNFVLEKKLSNLRCYTPKINKRLILFISGYDHSNSIRKGAYRISDFISNNLLDDDKNHFIFISAEKELIEYCSNKKISQKISFFPQLSHQNLMKMFYISDVFLLYSDSEGQPNTVIEALSQGCTVISTPVGSITEVIEHGKTGFLFNKGDDLLLLKSVNLALKKSKENPISQASISHYSRSFSEAIFLTSFDSIVDRLTQ